MENLEVCTVCNKVEIKRVLVECTLCKKNVHFACSKHKPNLCKNCEKINTETETETDMRKSLTRLKIDLSQNLNEHVTSDRGLPNTYDDRSDHISERIKNNFDHD